MANVEPQIERAADFESEAALAVGQLIGRQSEVDEHAIDRGQGEFIEDCVKFRIARLFEDYIRRLSPRFSAASRSIIGSRSSPMSLAAGPDCFEDFFAVTAGADSAVHDRHSGPQFEGCQGLLEQHGNVDGAHRRPRHGAGRRWRNVSHGGGFLG